MESPFKEYIEGFRKDGAMYWLFSISERAKWARYRNDIPLEIVYDCTEEEAEKICAKIRRRLQKKKYHDIWIQVLVYFNDTSAIEILEELVKYFKERDRVFKREGTSHKLELRMLKEAITHLKHVQKG